MIAEPPLTRYRLQQIVNSREQDLLQPSQPEATAELESYAEGTASQLLFLQVASLTLRPYFPHAFIAALCPHTRLYALILALSPRNRPFTNVCLRASCYL